LHEVGIFVDHDTWIAGKHLAGTRTPQLR